MSDAFRSIPDLIRENASRRPGHVALIADDGARIDHGGLDRMMDRVAAALQRDRIRPTESIAVCGDASIPYATLFLGALRAGIAVAPLATTSTPESLAAMIADSGTRLLFVDAEVAAGLGQVVGRMGVPVILLDRAGPEACFDDWLAPDGAAPAPVSIRPEWRFNIIYSSGTTGQPKGIVQSHAMRHAHVEHARALGYGPEATALVSTPLCSNTTLVSFFPAVALGGTAVLMRKFDAGDFLALAETHRVTHAMLVPVQYSRLMAHPDFDRYDLSSFRLKLCTSAPFPAALKTEVLKRWPGGLIEYFGMTEGGGLCVLVAHEWPDKLATVGRPAPGHDIRLIDEDGREVAPGEAGEIVGYSNTTMDGYHNRPDKTAEATWIAPDGRRFMRTGDIGRFDADGFLTLLDRKKDMIISGGFNIYSSDLEEAVRQHPDVIDVAVVGIPSDEWGETPVAFVISRHADAETIRAFANARLGKTQRLAAVEIVDELPRSHIGKVLKRDLRDRYTTA